MNVSVLKSGLLTTLQDAGREGHAALGVGHAGPMDAVALRLANALVGNHEDAAVIEMTLIGPRLRFDADAVIALVGAAFDAHIDDMHVPLWRPLRVNAGSELDCGRALRGTYACLAIAGGFDAARVLGSRASDVNAHLGPFGGRPLHNGDALAFQEHPQAPPKSRPLEKAARLPHRPHWNTTAWSLDPRPWFDAAASKPIHLIRGAQFDALDGASQVALFAAEFRVSTDSNRVGIRLDGPSLALAQPLELVSEAVAFGTLQLPPGGQPIALMAEHPTTGGYPRIGQVAAIDLPRLAQRKPGEQVCFAPIDLDDAQRRFLHREQALAELLHAIDDRWRAAS